MSTKVQIQIYNLKGQKVFETTVNSKQETINLREASGVYFIRITSDPSTGSGQTAVKKLVISE